MKAIGKLIEKDNYFHILLYTEEGTEVLLLTSHEVKRIRNRSKGNGQLKQKDVGFMVKARLALSIILGR